MRPAFASFLSALVVSACGGATNGLPGHLDVDGVGRMEWDSQCSGFACDIDRAGGGKTWVCMYAYGGEIAAGGPGLVQRAVAWTRSNMRTDLLAAQVQIARLMADYGMERSTNMAALLGQMRLSHLKIEQGGVELIFDEHPGVEMLNLTAHLSADLRFESFGFDG